MEVEKNNSNMRNVEIKALIRNLNEVTSKLNEMELGPPILINQHDEFYKIPHGRLKLRKFEDSSGELIYYDRPDVEGPKICSYNKASLCSETCKDLSQVLQRALGLEGEVKKSRHLYMLGQTRIHMDFVEGLGNYLELEVVLSPEQSVEEGEKIAKSIIEQLNIDKNDFIPKAYVDLLAKT